MQSVSNSSSLLLLPTHTFPGSSTDPPQAAASFRANPPSPAQSPPWAAVQISALTCCYPFWRVDVCSGLVLPTGCWEPPAPLWCLHGLQGNLCSRTWSTSSPFLPSVHRAVSHTFSFTPHYSTAFYLSSRASPVSFALQGGVGASCNCVSSIGSPGPSSQGHP